MATTVLCVVAEQRSAMEFLPGLLASGADPAQHASLLQALAVETKKLDTSLLDAWALGPIGMPRAPEGIPRSHWWWLLQGDGTEDLLMCFHSQVSQNVHLPEVGCSPMR